MFEDVGKSLQQVWSDLSVNFIHFTHSLEFLSSHAASNVHLCGFRGASFLGVPFDLHKVPIIITP